MSVFTDHLKATQLPEQAIAPIATALETALELTATNNKRIAAINAAKAQDPNNVEYLDSIWREKVSEGDKKTSDLEKRFQKLVDESEKLLAQLREIAKAGIQPPLSEEEIQKTRKLVNESSPAITKARNDAAAMATIVDQMLEMQGKAIEGGIISLLPDVQSMKNIRGRKAGGNSEKGVYSTRVNDVKVDDKSTIRNGKGHFNFAAEELSKEFDSGNVPQNEVSGEQLEEAYYSSLGVAFRDKNATRPDSHTFEFTKDVAKQNPNDESFTTAPVTKKITVLNWTRNEPKAETEKAEGNSTEAPAAKSETPAKK